MEFSEATKGPESIEKHAWWQKDVLYQIYPRSFKDSNGDGVGDLPGITEKLDYLKWLGVDCLWISPVYPSPMHDFGYDISDYKGIHPTFGTMDDFDHLLQEAKKRDLRILMDLVPNHTSDEHPWFLESRSSKSSPKRNWYIWKDPLKTGERPNNWISEFGGSGWEFDENTGQYYYHTFLKEQPDLNWYNEEVQEAIWDVMRFWFDKGVDGFRIDVLWYLIKDDLFRDNPPNPDWHPGMPEHDKLIPAFSSDQPYVHDLIEKMRAVADAYDEKVLIGEIYLPFHQLVTYYNEGKGVHLPFNFSLIRAKWSASHIYKLISDYEGALSQGDWPNWVLGNHDNSRVKSRLPAGQERVAAILLLTLRGTPTMYYGDEIGMEDVDIPEDRICDPRAIREPGINVGRDGERTPMQWSGGDYAGFSEHEPWLPLASGYQVNNVEVQKKDNQSLLWLYKKLIELRKNEPALQSGDYLPAGIKNEVLAYTRKLNRDRFLIVLNFGHSDEEFIPDFSLKGMVEITSDMHPEKREVKDKIELKGNQGIIIRLD